MVSKRWQTLHGSLKKRSIFITIFTKLKQEDGNLKMDQTLDLGDPGAVCDNTRGPFARKNNNKWCICLIIVGKLIK